MKLIHLILSITVLSTVLPSMLRGMDGGGDGPYELLQKAKNLLADMKKQEAEHEQKLNKLGTACAEADECLAAARKNFEDSDALEQECKKKLAEAKDMHRVGKVYLTLGILALICCIIDRCHVWYQNQNTDEDEADKSAPHTPELPIEPVHSVSP